ncbi:MAG TPA: TadE/TadG family type IV pilus assembly protein [Candidatus Sulfotelmatobacter sp.]|nr:TadE/TadG family type IV pilus assembly protein [Candidatus Sulfotelmatobacter sp.]
MKLRRLLRSPQGSEIAEAALVLPLMFMMLLAIFWFGQAFSMYGTITHAARQGARAALAPVCTTCGVANTPAQNAQNAYNAVQSALAASRLDPGQLSQPTTAPALCTCGSTDSKCTGGAVATCDPSQTTVCVQENVQLSFSGVTPSGAGECGMSVSFQYKYPHHFYLPCAEWPCKSLDLGQMSLPAQAQMRTETQ